MLVSHGRRFVFTKTVKTASTSVESYFERFCLPGESTDGAHHRDQYVGPEGIVGYRGDKGGKTVWHNHMAAGRIRELLGQDMWDGYFKFSIVRNPFDKMVSAFAMYDHRREERGQWQRFRSFLRRIGGKPRCIDRVTGTTPPERFRSWVANGGSVMDRDKYVIDGRLCVDFLIRFESLADGVRQVCERIGVPFVPEQLPSLKAGIRKTDYPLHSFYDDETRRKVEELYAFELEQFDYRFPTD